MDLANKRADFKRSCEGVWISGLPGWDDLRIKVRGSTSPVYRDAIVRLQREVPIAERNQDRSLSTDRADRLQGEILAEAGLLDWENLTILGVAIPYSKEKARELLTDQSLLEFQVMVLLQTERVGAIRDGEDFDRLGK